MRSGFMRKAEFAASAPVSRDRIAAELATRVLLCKNQHALEHQHLRAKKEPGVVGLGIQVLDNAGVAQG